MRRIIGTFEDDDVKANWDHDKEKADLANSKGEMYKRQFSVRTKYLIYILTQDNQRAHKTPIVLTVKGLNGTDLSEKAKLFEKEMAKCLSKALDTDMPYTFNEKFHATTVFCPVLVNDMRGANNVEICAVESFDIPDYSTTEDAIESLGRLTIPDEDRESTWKFQDMMSDYINMHSAQDAQRLKGSYGMANGVEILPANRTVDAVALPPVNADTGEDSAL
jgi:hypothetical protein